MSAPPLLAIDVGNSRLKAGLFAPAAAGELPPCLAATAFPIRDTDLAGVVARWLSEQSSKPAAALIGGVNPAVIAAVRDGWASGVGLTVVDRPPASVLVNRTAFPAKVGPDRLFDAVAVNRLRPPGVPAVVIDSGTATTVDRIDADGAFAGGAIVAGFETVAAALHERTALLPRVAAADLSPPPAALGRDTESALRSGLYWGLVGGVKELVARLAVDGEPPLVVLTGGAAPLLAPHLPAARVEPHLTLQGIALCFDAA